MSGCSLRRSKKRILQLQREVTFCMTASAIKTCSIKRQIFYFANRKTSNAGRAEKSLQKMSSSLGSELWSQMALNDFFITLDGIRHLSASFIASLGKFFPRPENPSKVQSSFASLQEEESKTRTSESDLSRKTNFHVCSFIEFIFLEKKLFQNFFLSLIFNYSSRVRILMMFL